MEVLIQEYGRTHPEKVFDKVQTYQDLIQANIAFLDGRVVKTPYYLGPVNEETLPLLPKLRKINSMGFVSFQGQPSTCQYAVFVDKTWTTADGKEAGNWFVDTEQKSYIEGILPRKYLAEVHKFLANRNDVYYYISDKYEVLDVKMPATVYNLTRQRTNKDEAWHFCTNMWQYTMEDEYETFDTPAMHRILDVSIRIMLAGTEYGTGSVEDIVYEFLLSQGL
jgi:prepilin-type processing-associated H-X9-DG protein